MKKILFLIACLPVLCFGQLSNKQQKLVDKYALDSANRIFPQIDGQIIYTGIVQVDSAKKDELFNRAKAWFVTQYKSANDVIQMEDKEAGILMGKGLFVELYNFGFLVGPVSVNVYHTVKVYVKDGKYKYEITDLNGKYYERPSKYSSGGLQSMPIGNVLGPGNKKNYKKFLEDTNAHVNSIIASLQYEMNKPLAVSNF